MKDFNNVEFVRYGSLNPKKHKEARNNEDSFHVAPCFKGIYAFPRGLVEKFLLGGVAPVNGKIQDRCFFLRDDEGNRIEETKDTYHFDEECNIHYSKEIMRLLKKRGLKARDLSEYYDEEEDKVYYIYTTNRHVFKYKGNIWHHLDMPRNEIIKSVREWNLSTYKNYVKALKRAYVKDKFLSYLNYGEEGDSRHGSPHSFPLTCTRDHYEVFISDKI